jgi:hypothetical protein
MKHPRLLAATALGLSLILALLWMLRGASGEVFARCSLSAVPPSLAREHAPAIISGSLLSNLTGCPLDEIFVYAYHDTTPIQIPFQIDERDTDGMYVGVEDGRLDDNDELVFMAIDAGGWVDDPGLDAGGTLFVPTYVITLTDPLSDTHAWAYIFRSTALTRTFVADYISYDVANDRITSRGRYTLGFTTTYGFMDYLALGGDSLNWLDRSKLRIRGTLPGGIQFSANEQGLRQDGVHAVDGPVRVTRVSTLALALPGAPPQGLVTLFAYRSLVMQPTTITVPGVPFEIAYQRTSMDWNERASGMIYYDANNPAGVTIDGLPDVITITPPSNWMQVSGVTGTVVSVNRIPVGLGGSQSTYYKDDSTINSSDTGDQRSYGDAGFQIENPNPGDYARLGQTYFLTGTLANVGTTYVDYYDNPVQVSAAIVSPALPNRVYLPITVR